MNDTLTPAALADRLAAEWTSMNGLRHTTDADRDAILAALRDHAAQDRLAEPCGCEECDDRCAVGPDGVVPGAYGGTDLPSLCADCANRNTPEGYPCHDPTPRPVADGLPTVEDIRVALWTSDAMWQFHNPPHAEPDDRFQRMAESLHRSLRRARSDSAGTGSTESDRG